MVVYQKTVEIWIKDHQNVKKKNAIESDSEKDFENE